MSNEFITYFIILYLVYTIFIYTIVKINNYTKDTNKKIENWEIAILIIPAINLLWQLRIIHKISMSLLTFSKTIEDIDVEKIQFSYYTGLAGTILYIISIITFNPLTGILAFGIFSSYLHQLLNFNKTIKYYSR
jgi:hypothetical protein